MDIISSILVISGTAILGLLLILAVVGTLIGRVETFLLNYGLKIIILSYSLIISGAVIKGIELLFR